MPIMPDNIEELEPCGCDKSERVITVVYPYTHYVCGNCGGAIE